MDFLYSPLREQTSMRLLRVLAEQDDHRIRIELWETEDAVPYRCLSYTWGDATRTSPILVNGQLKDVGENLYEFLELASRRFVDETIWIDALCINQADDLEKSAQVQRMGLVYKEAVEVLVWLGNDPKIANLFDWTQRKASMWNKISYYLPIDRTPAHLQDSRDTLARHDYWDRTWIVQEVIIARSLRILCRTSETTPEKLGKHHPIYRDGVGMIVLAVNWLDFTLWTLTPGWHSLFPRAPESHTFLTLLMKNQKNGLGFWEVFNPYSQCTDSRDRIYGILAITNQGADFDIDYKENVVDLFWRAGESFSAWQSAKRLSALIFALDLNSQQEAVEEALADPIRKALRCSVHLRVRKATVRTRLSRHKYCKTGQSNPVEVPNCGEHDLLLCSWDKQQSKHSGYAYSSHYISHDDQNHYVVHREQDSALSLTIENWNYPPEKLVTYRCPRGSTLWHVVEGTEREVTTWADITHAVSSEKGEVSGMTEGQKYILRLPFSNFLEDILALSCP